MTAKDYPEFNFSEISDADVETMRRWAMTGHKEGIEDLTLVAEIRGSIIENKEWRHLLQRKLISGEGGRAPRSRAEDRSEEVLDEYDHLRWHKSIRDDARRIADSTNIPFSTVRKIITEHLKKK